MNMHFENSILDSVINAFEITLAQSPASKQYIAFVRTNSKYRKIAYNRAGIEDKEPFYVKSSKILTCLKDDLALYELEVSGKKPSKKLKKGGMK